MINIYLLVSIIVAILIIVVLLVYFGCSKSETSVATTFGRDSMSPSQDDDSPGIRQQDDDVESFNIPEWLLTENKKIQATMSIRGCPSEYKDEVFAMSKKIFSSKLDKDTLKTEQIRAKLADFSKQQINKENICIVVLSTGDRPFAKKTIGTIKAYADKHGYDLKIRKENYNIPDEIDDKHVKTPNWEKAFWIQNLMSNADAFSSVGVTGDYSGDNSGIYDVIVWMDDDLLITNDSIRLEDIMAFDPSKDFYISHDRHEENVVFPYKPYFNSGFFIVRNNENGKKIMDEVVKSYYTYSGFNFSPYNDQTGIEYVYLNNDSERSGLNNSFKIFPHTIMQTLYNAKSWEPGHFICHLAGIKGDKRVKIIQDFEKKGYVGIF